MEVEVLCRCCGQTECGQDAVDVVLRLRPALAGQAEIRPDDGRHGYGRTTVARHDVCLPPVQFRLQLGGWSRETAYGIHGSQKGNGRTAPPAVAPIPADPD